MNGISLIIYAGSFGLVACSLSKFKQQPIFYVRSLPGHVPNRMHLHVAFRYYITFSLVFFVFLLLRNHLGSEIDRMFGDGGVI